MISFGFLSSTHSLALDQYAFLHSDRFSNSVFFVTDSIPFPVSKKSIPIIQSGSDPWKAFATQVTAHILVCGWYEIIRNPDLLKAKAGKSKLATKRSARIENGLPR